MLPGLSDLSCLLDSAKSISIFLRLKSPSPPQTAKSIRLRVSWHLLLALGTGACHCCQSRPAESWQDPGSALVRTASLAVLLQTKLKDCIGVMMSQQIFGKLTLSSAWQVPTTNRVSQFMTCKNSLASDLVSVSFLRAQRAVIFRTKEIVQRHCRHKPL